MQSNFLKYAAVAALVSLGGAAQAAVIHDDGYSDGTGMYRGVGEFNVNYNAAHAGSAAFWNAAFSASVRA